MEKKNLHFFGHCGNPPNCVRFPKPPSTSLGNRESWGSNGIHSESGNRLQRTFQQPEPGLCYSHLFTRTELLGYLQNCGRSAEGELPNPVWYLWSHFIALLCLPLSITTRVLFLHNTHIFCVDQLFHEETSQKMLLMPQQLEPCSGGV